MLRRNRKADFPILATERLSVAILPDTTGAANWSAVSPSHRTANRVLLGKASVNSSTCFAANSVCRETIPVMLPPGRARLSHSLLRSDRS